LSGLGLESSSAKWLPAGATVVAMYGATAGQVAFLAMPLTTNQAICGLIPKKQYRFFNYLALENRVSLLANQARGSAQQNISKGIIEDTNVIIPTSYIASAFDGLLGPYFDKWITNLKFQTTLMRTRDTLLPKLLSGELHIK